LEDLVFAADFNDLDMALRVLHAMRRAESVTLTMPWMGSKSDGRTERLAAGRLTSGLRLEHFRNVSGELPLHSRWVARMFWRARGVYTIIRLLLAAAIAGQPVAPQARQPRPPRRTPPPPPQS
jgi:hypothetical protein